MKFILFDIDGTLIDSGGAGSRALTTAFEAMFSVADAFSDIPMAGKTDPQIVREGLVRHGIDPSNGVVPGFFDIYIRHLGANLRSGRGHLKPGVGEILEVLAGRGDMVLGLLTGNIESGARLKLSHFGIASYFGVGAFGSDSEDRNALLPLAVQRLQRERGLSVDFRDCVIIGDTPRDVECARPYGAYALAVATGPYTREDLVKAGPDALFDDLTDTARLLSLLTTGK